MTDNDKRLIEDYLPIEAISKEASREKSVRKGHISTLHLWWAHRPLVACRAAADGALVSASRFRQANGPEEKRDSLTRANAAKFVERLCQYPGSPQAIAEAQKHILEAHAERLSVETGKPVTVDDIIEGRAPSPKVLDMFAGGGAIPLEALRLGCEATALDLNPVAHIIELCTLVYPQKYGKPDQNVPGMTGPGQAGGLSSTWGGLAKEVRYWGEWVLEKVKAEIGDLYPLISDPRLEEKGGRTGVSPATDVLDSRDGCRPSEERERAKEVGTYVAILINRLADYNSVLCHWHTTGEKLGHTFGRQALPMVWDFVELAPFGDASGSPQGALEWIVAVAESQAETGRPATVTRGSATALPWSDASFDAVVTDPPYYDNVPYADISDFFYVWLKRTIGHLYLEHFAAECTPKKNEIIAAFYRYGGGKDKARAAYEQMMAQSFAEANRVLKPGGSMVVVYAHKTTLGWSTLVDALRQAGFTVTEAWPLDTEMASRLRGMDSAALASSIFLVARKRDGEGTGSYEDEVRPELEKIVRERVDALWKMGIAGADLVIAAVGAGLRAYTRFSRVEYANGEEVLAEKFLAEVEGVVLETLLEKIFGMPGSGVAAVDGPSRFYVLWRYAYKAAEMEAGEAIVFTYGQNVELDDPNGLSTGRHALVEKRKGRYRLRDFAERGEDEKLGLPEDSGAPAPLIDALHRILWLVENQPRNLNRFLDEARPDRERLRLVAQALAGTALQPAPRSEAARQAGAGKKEDGAEHTVTTTAAEQTALQKLVANWRALIDHRLAVAESGLFGQGTRNSP